MALDEGMVSEYASRAVTSLIFFVSQAVIAWDTFARRVIPRPSEVVAISRLGDLQTPLAGDAGSMAIGP